ncbi:MAG: hypothetical protein ACKV2T_22125 [Kofleriaceae bacterium]
MDDRFSVGQGRRVVRSSHASTNRGNFKRPELSIAFDFVCALEIADVRDASEVAALHIARRRTRGQSFSRFTPMISNGGTAVAPSFDFSGVVIELALPSIVVPATEKLRLTVALQTGANPQAAVNALTAPAALTMKLPAGVSFDRNTTVPLSWVTNLP